MRFLVSEIKSVKKVKKQADLSAEGILGPAAVGIQYAEDLHASVCAELISNQILITGQVLTTMIHTCGRCLIDFKRPVKVVFQESLELDRDDIDVTENIRESVLLDVPLTAVCQESCKGLCATCGKNKNHVECHCETVVENHRWDALNQIRFKN
jgi:uncharacterized protein